jgi:hypothetical protein
MREDIVFSAEGEGLLPEVLIAFFIKVEKRCLEY